MNKLTSLEDTKRPEFEALNVPERIRLLDQFLDQVATNQEHFIRLEKAYRESFQKARAEGAAGRVANLQAIIDQGEELLDRLRGVVSPVRASKSKKKAEPAAEEVDQDILDLVRRKHSMDAGGDQ